MSTPQRNHEDPFVTINVQRHCKVSSIGTSFAQYRHHFFAFVCTTSDQCSVSRLKDAGAGSERPSAITVYGLVLVPLMLAIHIRVGMADVIAHTRSTYNHSHVVCLSVRGG